MIAMMQKTGHICFNGMPLTAIAVCVIFVVVSFGNECQDVVTNCQNTVSGSSVTFRSHCYGPKGRNRIGSYLYGYYLDYEFNSTNSLVASEQREDDIAGFSDVVREKISPPHMKYFDTVELWYNRPNHRLYRIDLKGSFPHDTTGLEISKFYGGICGELDVGFDVKLTRHVPSRKPLIYDSEGAIPGFKFELFISRLKCRMSIVSTRVLESGRRKLSSDSTNDVDVTVTVEDL